MKKKNIFIIIGLILVVSIILLNNNSNKNKLNDIDKVLESKYYVNLPQSAKKYIKETYEKTGEILKVEGNKKENEPYLNPEYIDYLEYKENVESGKPEDDVSYEVIPDQMIIDYTNYSVSSTSNEELPSSFDLRNVNGKNFTTPLKNQGHEGLCWAYATAAHMESKIMMDKNEPYNPNSTILISPKYFDYATSNNGIIDGSALDIYNSNSRKLTKGGRFTYIENLAVRKMGTVTTAWDNKVGIDNETKEANKIFGFNNSIYDVDSTVDYPSLKITELDLNNNEDYLKYENYIKGIKQLIYENGGAYISGNISGGSGCEVQKENGDIFIGNSKYCQNTGSHAEQLIGWDDNFEYQYCKEKDRKKDNIYDITSEDCVENSTITGKGAWLIRNSWGEDSKYAYYYIPYQTDSIRINAITKMNNKNWDNYYYLDRDYIYDDKTNQLLYEAYTKNTASTPQKIVKLKIEVIEQNERQYIYFGDDYNSLVKIAEYDVDYPGYYTIDLSDKNITLNPNTHYYLRIYNDNNEERSIYGNHYLFTNNIDESTGIKIDDYVYQPLRISDKKGYYQIRVNGYTEGIDEDELIDFKVFDKDNEEIDDIIYTDNNVFANHIFAKLYIPKTVDINQKFTIQALYNNVYKGTSTLGFQEDSDINGSGTIEDPYEITNSTQLNLINQNPSANFKLVNDIDLTFDTQDENGKFYNNGWGWSPIHDFTGSFDGQNHIIKGLYSKSGGLFGTISGKSNKRNTFISIKNLKLSDINVSSYNIAWYNNNNTYDSYKYYTDIQNRGVGALINNYYLDNYEWDKGYYPSRLELSNISILDGNIKEDYNYCQSLIDEWQSNNEDYCYINAGGIIGNITFVSRNSYYPDDGDIYEDLEEYIKLNNLYNGANVESTTASSGGIIGHIIYKSAQIPNYFTNILNRGNVYGKKYAGGIIGSFTDIEARAGRNEGPLYIENIINYGNVTSDNKAADIINENEVMETSAFKCKECDNLIKLKNIYYTGDKDINTNTIELEDSSYDNVQKTSINEIKDADFTPWNNFDTYWKKEADDHTKRIAMLKSSGFEYIKTNPIRLSINENKSLMDFITPNKDEVKNSLTYKIVDESIIEIDQNKMIIPKDIGSTTINVESSYDGYSGTISVEVVDKVYGTEQNPWTISNVEELNRLREQPEDYYIITKDIDLSGIDWEPIKYFEGHLEGNNHIISNLHVETNFNSAFIEKTKSGASIKDIIFKDVNIKGEGYVGTLISQVWGDNVTISNISVLSGNVIGEEEPYIGGIIGQYNTGANSIITNLYNGAKVVSDDIAAGIIGFYKDNEEVENVILTNLINHGEIDSKYASGLIGRVMAPTITISNAFQYGNVIGISTSDDIIGYKENSNVVNLENIYYVGNTNYYNESKNVLKKTHYEIANSNYNWNNFTDNYKKEANRIPMLKSTPFEYIQSLSNISLSINETKSIYTAFNPESNEVSNSLTFNIVDNSVIEIDNSGNVIPKKAGSTTVNYQSTYDGSQGSINIVVIDKVNGTKNNPWTISNVEELKRLNEYPNDYFVINEDIDLQNEEWEPIDNFSGHLNGNNHIIKNLNIQNPTIGGSGFFKQLSNGAEVKNIIFENINIKTMSWGGTLTAALSGDNLIVSNITVLNGNLDKENDSTPTIGGIVGKYTPGNNNVIENLYNGANIANANIGAGIIAYIYDSNNIGAIITNIMNRGNINGQSIGGLVGNTNTNTSVINAFQLSKITGSTKSDDIICNIENATADLINIRYINNTVLNGNNVSKKTVSEIANANYNNWNGFGSGFKHETINNVKRIPLLKNVNIEYTKLKTDEIVLEKNQEYNIYNNIDTTNTLIKDIKYTIMNSLNQDIIVENKGNGIIKGINSGNTQIRIESNYDGFSKNINVTVKGQILCDAGYYLPQNSIECNVCPKGSYCQGGTFIYDGNEQGRNDCPTGYTSDAESIANIECYLNVESGKYKTTATGSTINNCAAGYFREEHKSYYNMIDSCNICAAGSYSGIGASSCTACSEGNTSGIGSSSCDIDCNNNFGVSKWKIPSWENNIVNNSCRVDSCENDYELDATNNKCVPKEKEDKEYEIKDGYILNISKLTNLEDFSDKLDVADDETIKVINEDGNELENNEKIFTGSITKVFKGEDLVKQYTNIVVGDSNKDGDMDLSDIALTYKKVMNDEVEDELIFLSSNVNDDNILDISDVAKMYSYFMNDMEL